MPEPTQTTHASVSLLMDGNVIYAIAGESSRLELDPFAVAAARVLMIGDGRTVEVRAKCPDGELVQTLGGDEAVHAACQLVAALAYFRQVAGITRRDLRLP